jgi:hypothetical protein
MPPGRSGRGVVGLFVGEVFRNRYAARLRSLVERTKQAVMMGKSW